MTEADKAAWHYGGLMADSFRQTMDAIREMSATWAVMLRPTLTKDGNAWCVLHGDNLQVGVSGFGDTPAMAYAAFEIAMCKASGAWDVGSPKKEGV